MFGLQKKLYHDKEREIDNIFDEYHLPWLKYIDNPALIQEQKRNIDNAADEKN